MIRTIVGFRSDAEGDWVAELSCLHAQHVRHRPPFQERAWVLQAEERAAHVGTPIDCPLCDRAELPDGLAVLRQAGPWDGPAVPAGLRRDHRTAEGVWGVLRVLQGTVGLRLDVDPARSIALRAGEEQAIPPGTTHALTVDGPVRLLLEFRGRP